MKDGLECDARILRMRYSSLKWVSSLVTFLVSTGHLWLTHLEPAQRALSNIMAPTSVHAWEFLSMHQCSQQCVEGPCTG